MPGLCPGVALPQLMLSTMAGLLTDLAGTPLQACGPHLLEGQSVKMGGTRITECIHCPRELSIITRVTRADRRGRPQAHGRALLARAQERSRDSRPRRLVERRVAAPLPPERMIPGSQPPSRSAPSVALRSWVMQTSAANAAQDVVEQHCQTLVSLVMAEMPACLKLRARLRASRLASLRSGMTSGLLLPRQRKCRDKRSPLAPRSRGHRRRHRPSCCCFRRSLWRFGSPPEFGLCCQCRCLHRDLLKCLGKASRKACRRRPSPWCTGKPSSRRSLRWR